VTPLPGLFYPKIVLIFVLMPVLNLTTVIHAPAGRVFDLARCVSLHKRHFDHHNILPSSGKTSGVLDMRDYTLWQGKIGGKKRQFILDIKKMEKPEFYRDEMRKDFFDSFSHEHFFKEIDNGTIMIDQIEFELPHGVIGKLVNRSCAERNIMAFLKERNNLIKEYAEGNNWRAILP
jgi:ligand-binding SRPBCC domain-containing protein